MSGFLNKKLDIEEGNGMDLENVKCPRCDTIVKFDFGRGDYCREEDIYIKELKCCNCFYKFKVTKYFCYEYIYETEEIDKGENNE